MSKEDKYRYILSCLRHESQTKVQNALGIVRSKLLKEKGGVDKLCRLGFVSELLRLARDCEVTDIVKLDVLLSILSNMCMEKCARKAVVTITSSISTLVDILEETKTESVKNRTCRTLANLALDSTTCDRIMATAATELVVNFFKTTEDKECKKTCCRALRLFGHAEKHHKKVAEEGGVFPVASLIKEEDEELMDCGLRTLSELSNKCTIERANQIQNSGAIDKLVDLVREKNPSTKQYSFAMKILMNLTEQPNARPSVGNAGGITLFLSLMEAEPKLKKRIPLLNALCLFCKESVNRIRIREQGILEKLLVSLQDDDLSVLHGRIIGALVCFIYDEPSLNLLLSMQLIPILLKHLQSSADFTSTQNTSLRESINNRADIDSSSAKRGIQSPENIGAPGKRRKISVEETVIVLPESSKAGVYEDAHVPPETRSVEEDVRILDVVASTGIQSPENTEAPGKGRKITVEETIIVLPESPKEEVYEDQPPDTQSLGSDACRIGVDASVGDEVFIQPINKEEPFKDKTCIGYSEANSSKNADSQSTQDNSIRQHVYSLDSPTYEAQYSEWNLDDFKSSVKCKQSFSPGRLSQRSTSPCKLSMVSSPSYPETYSPLSTTSYHSPNYSSQHSPLYQPFVSPASSPLQGPVYSGFSSPQRSPSPSELSERNEGCYSGVGNDVNLWEYSSDEDSTDDIKPCSSLQLETVERGPPKQPETSTKLSSNVLVFPKAIETKNSKAKRNLEKSLEDGPSEPVKIISKSEDNVPKTPVHAEKSCPTPNEDNLSTTLAHVAESCANPSKYKEDEGSSSSKEMQKKSRVCQITEENVLILLSRVSQMSDPSKYLVTEDCISCLIDYITLTEKPNPRAVRILRRLVRNLHCLEALLDVLMPIYVLDKLQGGEFGMCAPLDDTLIDGSFKVEEDIQSPSKGISSEGTGTDDFASKNAKEIGATLLQDLSFVVESPFGRGTIAHILKRKPDAQRIRCVLCLPFLCRSKPSQQKTLFDDGALRKLLALLKADCFTDLHTVAIEGLHYLCANLDVKLRLPEEKQAFPADQSAKAMSLSLSSETTVPGQPHQSSDCIYVSVLGSHDVTFLLEGGLKCTASRTTLVSVCPVFQAMLLGDYTEARQTEIKIPHVSPEAFKFVLHFFHGCDSTCSLVQQVIDSEFPLEGFLDILSLTDRYLLVTLSRYLEIIARQEYLNTSTVADIYHFSVLHNYNTLAEDCLRFLFMENLSDLERRHHVEELLFHGDVEATYEHLYQVIKSHTFGTQR